MIIVVERVVAFTLMGVLVFNMTQRRHIEGGESKRMATLLVGMVLLFFLAGVFALKQNAFGLGTFGSAFFYPLGASTFLLFLALRKRILVFRRSCKSCGAVLNWKTVLYRDHNLCNSCLEAPEAGTIVGDGKSLIAESVDQIDWESWEPKEKAVICYIVDEENKKVLLMHKKTGLGKGKVNAPGGRIEKGETPYDAAVRECIEEVHLTPKNLEKRMELHFQFTDGYSLQGEAFFCTQWEGEAKASLEADPFWCPLTEIPYDRMWEDDIHWLPRALQGEKLKGYWIFDGDSMLSQRLQSLADED